MNSEAEQLWATALAQLRTLVPPDDYELWLAPVRAVQLDATALTLEVADEFCVPWLRDRHAHLLCEVVTRVAGRPLEPRFQVAALASPASGRKPGAPSGFNPRNTFDAFIVGNNQFAHSVALAVAQAPGEAYNPLLLFGATGLGKTHLLHAIGSHAATRRPDMRVRCVTMEQFMQEFTLAGQGQTLGRFRRQYRVCDLWLVDDVQCLAGKERLQREFLELLSALHASRKQIVLASDRPADEIPGLDPALAARFESGLVTDLQPPDFETRLNILHRRAAEMSVGLPDELARFLAKRISANVRRLEGALIRVVSYASLSGESLNVPMAKALFGEVLQHEIALVEVRRPNQVQMGPRSDSTKSAPHPRGHTATGLLGLRGLPQRDSMRT